MSMLRGEKYESPCTETGYFGLWKESISRDDNAGRIGSGPAGLRDTTCVRTSESKHGCEACCDMFLDEGEGRGYLIHVNLDQVLVKQTFASGGSYIGVEYS